MADPLKLQLEILATGAGKTVGQIRDIQKAIKDSGAESKSAGVIGAAQANKQSIGLAEVAFRFNNVIGALQNLKAAAAPVYDALIGANERLNAQILSSQTNLASSTRIFQGDTEITDPTAKINATRGAIKQALKEVEAATQDLVGVTSSEVNELFQITLTNAASLNNQSKQFPDAIASATALTKGWAASLKVIGVPLNQARQEINSILKGQIDQNSILAKNLNITNTQVSQWQAQGRLVDELNKRLDVFVAGNAIAARSIEGIGSNIVDLVERLGRGAGEPFLEPIINALASIEQFLKANEKAITTFFAQLADAAIGAGTSVAKAFAPAGKSLLDIGADLGPIALSAIKGLIAAFVGVAQVIAPLADLTLKLTGLFTDFAATGLGGVIVQTGVLTTALAQLFTIVAGISAAAFPALFASALKASFAMGGLYLSLQGVAAGNLAVATTSPIMVAALTAITAAALPLAAALLPLTAAVGLGVLLNETNKLRESTEALEVYGDRFRQTIGVVGEFRAELKKLDAVRKAGGVLTAEQLAREKQLKGSAQTQSNSIRTQIEDLKNLGNLNADQSKFRDGMIEGLEAQAKKLAEVTGGLNLQAKSLEVLGTTAEQYARKVADNQRQIKNEANGVAEDFKKAAKEAVDLAKTGVESKQITVEAARAQLQEILNNTKVDLDAQIAAKKAIDDLVDGRIAKIEELIEVGRLQANEGIDELSKVRDDGSLEPTTRRKAAQQIVAIRKEQIATETAAIAAQQAQISALQAEQRLGEQIGDQQATGLKIAEINKQIEAQRAALDNSTSDSEREKILAEIRKTDAERSKLSAEFEQRERKRLVDDFDFRRNLIKAESDLGITNQAQYNQRLLENNLRQADLEIQQQKDAAAKLAADDNFGYNQILAKTSELQSKRVGIIRQYDETAIKQSNDYYDQYLRALEAFKANSQVSEAEFNSLRLQNRLEAADQEIKLQQLSLSRLGKNDIEGRNAIEAKILDLRSKRIAAFDQLYQTELEQVKRYQAEANNAIQQSETERSILAQNSANRQLSTTEQNEQNKLDNQRKTLQAQLELAKSQEAELAKLANKTRSPESERAYQSEVRAAQLATTQATLRLLEQEGQQIQQQRGLAIRAIEDRAAAQNRAADAQLGKISQVSAAQNRASRAAEAGSDREKFALDRISKSLELQNNLQQARLNLARAQQAIQDTTGDIEQEKVKSAIELTKQLENESLSDKERLIIQQRLNDLVGSNTQSVYQLTVRQRELEDQAAQRKQAALFFEQEQARIQLVLEQKKNDLVNQRAVIEARIGELKAKQSLLDAQNILQQERINSRKSIQSAQGEVDKAQKLAPGQERDRALADAQAKLDLAKQTAGTQESNALQGIDLAKQQVEFAGITVQQAQAQKAQQEEINRLQTATLSIQQQAAKTQADATESARKYADELARARAEAERLAGALNSASPTRTPLPQRAGGGSVRSGQPTIVGEKEQEVFIPGANGVVLNQQQIVANLGLLTKGAGLNFGNSTTSITNRVGGGQGAVVQQLQQLQAAIEGRPPAQVNPSITFGSPTSEQSDQYFKMLRSIERGAV